MAQERREGDELGDRLCSARTGTHMLFPDPDGIRLELFYEPGKKG